MGCGASSGPPPHTDAYTDAYKRQLTADLMMARKARDRNAAEMVLDAFGICDAFMVLDKDGNGYVTAAELRAIMPTNVPAAEVDAMLREADLEDHDGRLNYEEFVRFVDPAGYGAQGRHFEGKVRRAGELMIAHLKIDPDSEVSILEAFKPLDSDHNGFVSYADLRHVLTNLDENLTDEEVGDVLRAVDAAGGAAANGGRAGEVARGDGQICYEDFVSFVKAIGKRSSAVWDIPTGTVVERKWGSRKERAATSSGKVAPDSRPTNGSIAKLAVSSPSGKGLVPKFQGRHSRNGRTWILWSLRPGSASDAAELELEGPPENCRLRWKEQNLCLEVDCRNMKEGRNILLWNDDPPVPAGSHSTFTLNDDGSISPSRQCPGRNGGDPSRFALGLSGSRCVLVGRDDGLIFGWGAAPVPPDAKLEYEWAKWDELGSSKVLQTLDLDKLTKKALESHCDARDLEIGGTKRAMVKRLQADLERERLQATEGEVVQGDTGVAPEGGVVGGEVPEAPMMEAEPWGEAACEPPPLHDIVDALKRNLGLDGTWPEVVDAGCLQLGVPPTGSLQEKGDACWRAMEG